MSEMVFLCRVKEDDRDCCKYIETKHHLDCIGEVILDGPNFCGRWKDDLSYDNVETFLNENDYNIIIGKNVSAEDYNRIVDILQSKEAQEFCDIIMESEKEYLCDEYNLSDEDIEKIFDDYYLDYRDRGIIGGIYEDSSDVGYNEAWEFGYLKPDDSISSKYFDYERFGEDLVEESDRYFELDDGRVVSLCY